MYLAGCINCPLWIVCPVDIQDLELPETEMIGWNAAEKNPENLQPLPEKVYCRPGCGFQEWEIAEQEAEEQEAAEGVEELRASMYGFILPIRYSVSRTNINLDPV